MKTHQTLISEYLYGTSDEAGNQQLSSWIKQDPQHADFFIREAFIHSRLGSTLRGQSAFRELGSVSQDLRGLKKTKARSGQLRLIGLAAALILVCGVTSMLIRHQTELRRVASVQSAVNAQWEGVALSAGTQVKPGSYRLIAGLARIDFSEGGQVIVEGPASFAIDRKLLRLDAGQVVVSCPTKTSRNLVLETKDAHIIDLGTEYGVSTDQAAATRVQVFKGSIQITAKPAASQSVILQAGDAWQSQPGNLTTVSHSFIREGDRELLARSQASAPGAKWATYLRQSLTDHSLIFASDFCPLWDGKSVANLAWPDGTWLTSLSPDSPVEFAPGRFADDQSLNFSKLRQGLRLDLPDHFRSLSFAAWIKLDSEPIGSQRHRGLVMSDGWGAPGEVHWQIKKHGIRLTLFNQGDDEDPRYSANAETLFDGNWHQCVSIIDTKITNSIGTVSHYLDGKLIYSRTIPRPIPNLMLGKCCVGNWVPSPQDLADDRTLGGQVDDLLIWSRPLSAAEVLSLYEAGAR